MNIRSWDILIEYIGNTGFPKLFFRSLSSKVQSGDDREDNIYVRGIGQQENVHIDCLFERNVYI